MPSEVDLHLHTSHSDGVLSASELLGIIRKQRLKAFSITDHDTLDGYRTILPLMNADDPEIVPGVELSVTIGSVDMHLLAYFFDPDNSELTSALKRFRQGREDRAREMVDILQGKGLKIDFETVKKIAKNSVIGRPHIADGMVLSNAVSSVEEAFGNYLGNDCSAYVPKSNIEPEEALKLIHNASGLTIMAHPFISDMYKHIEKLTELGLDGIEIWHYSHNKEQIKILKGYAKRYRLLGTGGSDFHGRSEREGQVGSFGISFEHLQELKVQASLKRGKTEI